jgi:hypothetical protein
MGELRKKMEEDMTLRGLSSTTQNRLFSLSPN